MRLSRSTKGEIERDGHMVRNIFTVQNILVWKKYNVIKRKSEKKNLHVRSVISQTVVVIPCSFSGGA